MPSRLVRGSTVGEPTCRGDVVVSVWSPVVGVSGGGARPSRTHLAGGSSTYVAGCPESGPWSGSPGRYTDSGVPPPRPSGGPVLPLPVRLEKEWGKGTGSVEDKGGVSGSVRDPGTYADAPEGRATDTVTPGVPHSRSRPSRLRAPMGYVARNRGRGRCESDTQGLGGTADTGVLVGKWTGRWEWGGVGLGPRNF